MRYLWLSVVIFLVACGSDDKASEPKSYALNGFWNGQLDQGEDIRMLIYNGEVFALDAEQGYYGQLTYSDFNLEAKLTLSAKVFVPQSEATNEYITDSASTPYVLTGMYYSSGSAPELIGDYKAAEVGSFILNHDGAWKNGSSLNALKGEWQADDTQLRIEPKNNRYEFRGVKLNGCTFSGGISLLNSDYSLYAVDMKERRGCVGSIKTAQGYAALNDEGDLEFYLRSGGSLLFMTFSPSAGGVNPSPVEPNPEDPPVDDETPDDGTGDEVDNDTDGEA